MTPKEIKVDGNSIQIGNKICYCIDKDLIDYITNLQQENKAKTIQIETLNEILNYENIRNDKLQQENERLKEIEKEHKNCTRKHWQQKCFEHSANEKIYKSRNEKAIECIEKNQERKTYYGGICDGEDYYILYNSDEVLNILNGVDENE